MKKALYLVTFLAGAAVGAFGAVAYIKKNYDISEKDEEGEEVSKPVTEKAAENEIADEDEEDDIARTNRAILSSVKDPKERARKEAELKRYFNDVKAYGDPSNIDDILHSGPYKIRPDEFSQFEDYEAVELTLYADGVLADDRDEPVENAEELLGADFKDMFDEGSDELYIRNDLRCCDYAILKDVQTFDAFDESRPHFSVED